MANSGNGVFALLRDIESRSRQKALGLPQQLEIRPTQTGIGFLLQNIALVVATSEISEILPYPPLTRIPGTVDWMKGVANIRGTLIPVIDLLGFAKQETARLNRKKPQPTGSNRAYPWAPCRCQEHYAQTMELRCID